MVIHDNEDDILPAETQAPVVHRLPHTHPLGTRPGLLLDLQSRVYEVLSASCGIQAVWICRGRALPQQMTESHSMVIHDNEDDILPAETQAPAVHSLFPTWKQDKPYVTNGLGFICEGQSTIPRDTAEKR